MSQSNAIIAAVTTIGGIALAAAVSVSLYFGLKKDSKSGDDNSSPSGFDADILPEADLNSDNDTPTPAPKSEPSPKLKLKPIAPKIPQPKPGSQQQMIRFKDIKSDLAPFIAKNPKPDAKNKPAPGKSSHHSLQNYNYYWTVTFPQSQKISINPHKQCKIYSPIRPKCIEGDILLKDRLPRRNTKKRGHIILNRGKSITGTSQVVQKYNLPVKKIGEHVFSDPYKAGGGFRTGAIAQEEDCCRYTNAVPFLTDDEIYEKYYAANQLLQITDRVLYIEGATELDHMKHRDLIFAAAPDIGTRKPSESELLELKNRTRRVFEVAYENNCNIVTTGAVGCGVFGWDIDDVTLLLKELLIDEEWQYCFDFIIINVPSNKPKSHTIDVFKQQFKGKLYKINV